MIFKSSKYKIKERKTQDKRKTRMTTSIRANLNKVDVKTNGH